MSGGSPRVVFDCNVYFQALIGRHGPAAACVHSAARREVQLYCSEHTIQELLDVCSRNSIQAKFRIEPDALAGLIKLARSAAIFVDSPPDRYTLTTDPKDSHYINLALAASATLIVSRDRDLLRLMDPRDREGVLFRHQFPQLTILDPSGMLRLTAKPG